jgi:hypothetical protein
MNSRRTIYLRKSSPAVQYVTGSKVSLTRANLQISRTSQSQLLVSHKNVGGHQFCFDNLSTSENIFLTMEEIV